MKMFKRFAAAMLAAVMVLIMLTACDGVASTQDKVLANLNEARAQNGVAALEWSEEANAHARNYAREYEKLVSTALNNSGHLDSELDRMVTELVYSTADGKNYKTMMFLEDPDMATVMDLVDEKVAKEADATVVGMASYNLYNQKTMVIIVY